MWGLLLGNGPTEMVGLWMATGKAEETRSNRNLTLPLTLHFDRGVNMHGDVKNTVLGDVLE